MKHSILESKHKTPKTGKKLHYKIERESFFIPDYYKPIGLIVTGAYSVLCEAIDTRDGSKVAIKKMKGVLDHLRDARRILREVKLLKFVNHKNIIQLFDIIKPNQNEKESFNEIYLIMPKMETNLAKVIKSNQKLTNRHYQLIIYQILKGIKFLHSAGIIHKYLTPEYILINTSDFHVKMCHFGSCSVVDIGESFENNGEYIVSRWCKPPEIMCNKDVYVYAADIWNVGCILGELILRKQLFPGQTYLDKLKIVFNILGIPKTLDWIKTPEAKRWVNKLKPQNDKNFNEMFSKVSNECRDLLSKMLKLNPNERITAKKGLEHKWLNEFYNESTEPIAKTQFILDSQFEKSIQTKVSIRNEMFETIWKTEKIIVDKIINIWIVGLNIQWIKDINTIIHNYS